MISDNAGGHNCLFVWRDITDEWNSGEVSQNIANGSFKNIYPGNYIRKTKKIDGITYTDHIDIIVELDPYYGKWNGSKGYINTHHVAIIPYEILGESYMNDYDENSHGTTAGGFRKSYMLNVTLPKYLTGYSDAYGSSHLLSFGHLISNNVSTTANSPSNPSQKGCSINNGWSQTKITLMTENHVYGNCSWGTSFDIGEGCKQLAAFQHCQELMHFLNGDFWLRSVANTRDFVAAGNRGFSYKQESAAPLFVRPLLLLF